MSQPIQPIPTRYAGCHFRSRLEARWAVFFDKLGARWEYEPQGFMIDGTPYLPDFLLTDCGTWVEVKGSAAMLDVVLLQRSVELLPKMTAQRGETGPHLMLLGPIPEPIPEDSGDWGWQSWDLRSHRGEQIVDCTWHGFGAYQKNLRPWYLCNASKATPYAYDEPADEWLKPALDEYEYGVPDAYRAARSARFEHGWSGAS